MSRGLFALEKGIRIQAENDETSHVDILFGSGAPGGDSGDQDDAGIGSIYGEISGKLYRKTANVGNASDWTEVVNADLTQLSFRSEKVIAATGDVAPSTGSSIDLSANPFGDDEGTLLTAADFAVNDCIIFGVGGTPKIMKVSAVSSPSITVVNYTPALADNYTYVVKNYLPDSPADQEAQALVVYQGGAIIKISDFNWGVATGISLSGAFSALVGIVAAGDTVEVAISKLEASVAALVSLSGVSRGATSLGTFTGAIIPDTSSVKAALQSLETYIEGNGRSSGSGITSLTTVDSVLVDNVKAVKWYVMLRKTSAPAQIKAFELFVVHNGTSSADATLRDKDLFSKLELGANFNSSVDAVLSGSGTGQILSLKVSSTESGGVDVFAFREIVA